MNHAQEIKNTPIRFGILHNRKAAGTAFKAILDEQNEINPLDHVEFFGHAMTLPLFVQQYPSAQAIFFIREPISRFVSGFNSRLRQGLPRYHYPWSSAEARAFASFKTPNALAEALSSWNPLRRYRATRAMKSIAHVRHTYLKFLGTTHFLESIKNRIAYIGHQPEFDQDLNHLRHLLRLDPRIEAPTDAISAHRNPQHLDTHLSPLAIANLQRWYRADFAIYDWCLNFRKQTLAFVPK